MSSTDSEAHEVLGVPVGAGALEVRIAWRRIASETHPDRGGDAEAFRRAKVAFEQLGTKCRGPTLVARLGPSGVARRWWRRRRDRVQQPRVL